jgi:DNA-binding beta-propeller fold protein YncE
MRAHGIDKPIWVSETNVAPRDDPVRPVTDKSTFAGNAPLALQPTFLVQSFAASLGLGAPRVEIYLMRDNPGRDAQLLGLARYDGSVRPEAQTFATIARWFGGVTATRYDPGSEPLNDSQPLWRVTMECPGQEVQVIWNGSGKPINATVPAVAATATVVRPDGATAIAHAAGGVYTFRLAAATDPDPSQPTHFKIGGTPLIVVQNLPPGQHVPGLQPLFIEQDRTAGAGTTIGAVGSIAVAPDNSGTRAVADTSHDRVLIEDAAGHITAQVGQTGGDPGQFRGPAGVAIGADGTLYVADQVNARIQEFDLSGRLLGGFGSYIDLAHPDASLKAPSAVAAAPDGTIYVLDEAQDAVLHFTRMGVFLGRWGGPGYGPGQFDGPGGLAVDRTGDVYVADTLNNRVEAFDSTGHLIGQVGTGQVGAGIDGLHWPVAVAPLSDGRLAISDADNARVILAPNPQSYLGAVPTSGLKHPGGLAIAADGSYYVSDMEGNQIVHLDASGRQLATFGTRGRGSGQLLNPMGLALSGDGTLYVADSGNNRIDAIQTSADGMTFERSFGRQGNGPGQFLGPQQVALAPDGTLWVADTDNARLQHLRADGSVIDASSITHVGGAWGVVSDGHDGVYYSVRYGHTVKHWTPRGTQTFGSGHAGAGSGEFDHPAELAAGPGEQAVYVVDEDNKRLQFIAEGKVAGQRGGAGPNGGDLGDPVAVAVARDGSVVVLDAARDRLVRYQGASGQGFRSIAVPGTPLGLAADSHGLVAAVYDPLLGTGSERALASNGT